MVRYPIAWFIETSQVSIMENHCDRLNSPLYVYALMLLRSIKRIKQMEKRITRKWNGETPAHKAT
jgi:hypothetical protein